MITQERLKELLRYDQETGVFTWRVRASNRIHIGDMASNKTDHGYGQICISGKRYRAHRLAWLYVTGRFPRNEIDHKNGIRDDNRWANLREATPVENRQNLAVYATNTSGFTGVCWHKPTQRWMARIHASGKQKCLGYFEDKIVAAAVYAQAKAELHQFNPTARGT